MNKDFTFQIRIYYEDTDFSGNTYHGSYVKFFERARTEWLRELNIHHHELAKIGLAFAVSKMEIDFLKASHIDDLLEVTTKIISLTGARIMLEQAIACNGEDIAKANVVVAVINSDGKATRLPKHWRSILLPYLNVA